MCAPPSAVPVATSTTPPTAFMWCPCGRVMDGLCPTELCKRCNKTGDQDEVALKPDKANTEYVIWPSHCGPLSNMVESWCPCGRVMAGEHGDCPTKECESCAKQKKEVQAASAKATSVPSTTCDSEPGATMAMTVGALDRSHELLSVSSST